jgi:hypothetical protein
MRFLLAIGALLWMRGIASAAPLLLEVRAPGGEPKQVERDVSPWLEALSRRLPSSTLTASAVAAKLVLEAGRLARDVDEPGRARIRAAVERGEEQLQGAKLDEALRGLAFVGEEMDILLGGDTHTPQIRVLLFRALIAQTQAYLRKGMLSRAAEVADEAVLHLPEQEASRREQGPEALEIVKAARLRVATRVRGTLRVESVPAGRGVLVDGRYAGLSPVVLKDLPSAAYRVEVLGNQSRGRIRAVNVASGTTLVRVDAEFEEVVSAEGLIHADLERAPRLAALAGRLGRLLRADPVFIIGVRGRDVVVARIAASTGVIERWQEAPLGSADREELLRGLVDGAAEPVREALAQDRDPWWTDRWGWVITSAGASSMLVGGILLNHAATLKDEAEARPFDQRPQARSDAEGSQRWGLVLLAAGALTAISGAVKLASTDTRGSKEHARVRWTLSLVAAPWYIGGGVVGLLP